MAVALMRDITLPFPIGRADIGLLQPQDKMSRHRCRILPALLRGSDYIFIQLQLKLEIGV